MFHEEHHRLLIFLFDQVKHCDVNEIFELAFFKDIYIEIHFYSRLS